MDCVPRENVGTYIQWIYTTFGACVYGYMDALSILFGYLSIFCWLNAQVPQMITNYKLQSADGLSLYLLYFWLAGDLGNMFSCVLNHQLPFQTYLAAYFVSTDLILIYQYFRYRNNVGSCCNDKIIPDQSGDEESLFLTRNHSLEMTNTIDSVTPILNGYGSTHQTPKSVTSFMALVLLGYKSSLASGVTEQSAGYITFGWALAWICTSFYILSRIPQIYKNHKRQSTDGLSIALFTFAVCGNITYALSILFHPGHTRETIMESLPYVYGSFGTLFFDAVIFGQFLHYRKKDATMIKTTTSVARILTFE